MLFPCVFSDTYGEPAIVEPKQERVEWYFINQYFIGHLPRPYMALLWTSKIYRSKTWNKLPSVLNGVNNLFRKTKHFTCIEMFLYMLKQHERSRYGDIPDSCRLGGILWLDKEKSRIAVEWLKSNSQKLSRVSKLIPRPLLRYGTISEMGSTERHKFFSHIIYLRF